MIQKLSEVDQEKGTKTSFPFQTSRSYEVIQTTLDILPLTVPQSGKNLGTTCLF